LADAGELETLYQQHKDDGLMVFSAWSENESGQPPSVEDLNRWADEYGLTTPVIADPFGDLGARFNGTSPVYVLLEPGMVINQSRAYLLDAEIQALIDMAN